MAEKWNVCIARSALVHCCTIFIWDLGWSIQMYTSMLRSSSWEITSSAWSKKMSEMLFNSDKLAGKDHFAPLLLQGLWRWPQDYILHLISSPDVGEACMDAMADLAAANAPNLELIAVSTDSLPVHRYKLPVHRWNKSLSSFIMISSGESRGTGEAHDHAGWQDWMVDPCCWHVNQ